MIQNSNAPQTLAWEPIDSPHVVACPRVSVPDVLHLLPPKYVANFQNHPSACCKDATNLDIEAWYSGPSDQAKRVPDLYKFYCKVCNACHARFCVGGNHPEAAKYTPQERPDLFDQRPFWEIR